MWKQTQGKARTRKLKRKGNLAAPLVSNREVKESHAARVAEILSGSGTKNSKEKELVDLFLRFGTPRDKAVKRARSYLKKPLSVAAWPINKGIRERSSDQTPAPPELLFQQPNETQPEADFQLTEDQERRFSFARTRINQAGFRAEVLSRYGAVCLACGLSIPHLIEAAHVRDKRNDGSDDARNGLALCANHHLAFDLGLFGINPTTLAFEVRDIGPDLEDLRIQNSGLRDDESLPAPEALDWAYKRFRSQ